MLHKKALLIFPPNVLVCYDLHIISIYNKFSHKMSNEDRIHLENMLLDTFNGNPIETPLHKLMKKQGKLVLCDLLTEQPSDYPSINKFIYAKSRFFTIEIYDWLIKHGYKDFIHLTPVEHKNITVQFNMLDQFNNFIVYDNRNWNEYSIMKSIYGGEERQYIDRDKIVDWFKGNIDKENNGFLDLTLVSDAFDIDRELAFEAYYSMGQDCRFVETELRICCINSENMRRYDENKSIKKDFYRSSVTLNKLWDQNYFG